MDLSRVNVRGAWVTIVCVSLAAVALLVWIIYFKEQPEGGEQTLTFLPLLNCILNALSASCLIAGFLAIKWRRPVTHIRWMLAAFLASTLFLVSYILHHHLHGDSKFPEDNPLRPAYLGILASHVLLSIVCLPMVLMTFFLGLSGRLSSHKRIAKFTFPIWLYVSVTGVLIFALLKWATGQNAPLM